MRVWHSPCSWLNAIEPLDSVAGNTLIGMFTRLIFRKPFHVARAAIQSHVPSREFQVRKFQVAGSKFQVASSKSQVTGRKSRVASRKQAALNPIGRWSPALDDLRLTTC